MIYFLVPLKMNKCKINLNISRVLDEKKQIFSQLPEYLTQIASKELVKYDLYSCNVMYIPQKGFLFVISGESFIKSFRSHSETTRSLTSNIDFNGNSVFVDTGEQVIV